MRPWLLALVALGGCSYVWRIDHWDYPEDAPPQPDSPPLPDAGPCPGMLVGHQGGFASGLLEYCVKSPASVASSFSIPDGFNTSNDVMCDDLPTVAGVQLCVKVASHILSTSVAADPLGTRPLVLIGLDSITITSNVNMSTHTNGNVGPGWSTGKCASNPGTMNVKGGSGGGGGSFGTAGGKGGPGGNSTAGGAAISVVMPTYIRSGCAGGAGGDGSSLSTGGAGGQPGGAIYLISPNTITISANINASGSGGFAGHKSVSTTPQGGGGGGGGSGGLIGLDAPNLVLSGALLFANGGGGASGGNATLDGVNGGESTSTNYLSGGTGGTVVGGAGGNGGGADTAGYAGTTLTSGGGGGGGEGYILIYTTGPKPSVLASPSPYVNGAQ